MAYKRFNPFTLTASGVQEKAYIQRTITGDGSSSYTINDLPADVDATKTTAAVKEDFGDRGQVSVQVRSPDADTLVVDFGVAVNDNYIVQIFPKVT